MVRQDLGEVPHDGSGQHGPRAIVLAAASTWTSAAGEAPGSASAATTAATAPRPDDLVLDLTQRLHALVLRLISVRAGGAGTATARARGCGPQGRQQIGRAHV